MNESQETTPQSWQPNRGPVAKIVAWLLLILIFAGLLVMMIYE